MAQRNTGRFIGALAALAVFLPLMTAAGCKLFNKEKKPFGEDCQSDEDCESLECATYGSVCTKACTYDRECGGGFVCRARDGRPGDACAKPTGVANGQSCNNPSECQSGNCLKPVGQADAAGFCSVHCEAETDCPDGFKLCLSISDSGQTKFCLPGGGGSANIPGTEPPKFVAPRPVATVKVPTTATATATATATVAAKPTSQPVITTAVPTATATAAPTTTASATTQPTATATASTTIKKPPVLVLPKKPK